MKFNPRALDRMKYELELRSDSQLAKHLGVDRSTVARWRHGISEPGFKATALMILKGRVPLDELTIDEEVAA